MKSGPGKYAARLGLSFTSTMSTVEVCVFLFLSSHDERGDTKRVKIFADEMVELPDARAEDGTLVTDGVCMIRQSEAKEICYILEAPMQTSGKHRFRRIASITQSDLS